METIYLVNTKNENIASDKAYVWFKAEYTSGNSLLTWMEKLLNE